MTGSGELPLLYRSCPIPGYKAGEGKLITFTTRRHNKGKSFQREQVPSGPTLERKATPVVPVAPPSSAMEEQPGSERPAKAPRKVANQSGSPQRLRCQRRSGSLPNAIGISATSERRNERERNRVKLVNLGFAKLRQHVPQAQGPNKKMSKVETLRSAVEYIRALQSILMERTAGEGQGRAGSDGLSPCGSSCSVDSGSLALSPGSCSSCASEDSSRGDSSIAETDFFLTLHGWGMG
ncbi:hypothetical protein XENTR_v10019297 [Xenopus tropicalis]|uniref:Achaete-scute homolog 1 n=2 Tax=Xenopus tropicalis TaxID=8364 RepID=A0A8J0QTZ5_XENTR|nr:achaete-scute homolog 1 [Xenopus tropicalis]KAE8593748.1 hypothetical protein XENTR_v10019297 [Xenopus tropicalis]